MAAAHLPEVPEAGGEAEAEVRRGVQAPLQRGAEVPKLALEMGESRLDRGPLGVLVRGLGEVEEPGEVLVAGWLSLAGVEEAVAGVLADGFEEAVAVLGEGLKGLGVGVELGWLSYRLSDCLIYCLICLLFCWLIDEDEGLVDEGREEVEDLEGVEGEVGGDGLGGVEGEAAGEDGEASEESLLGGERRE
jgi:hypothetical protein